jgi:hypothetical protein
MWRWLRSEIACRRGATMRVTPAPNPAATVSAVLIASSRRVARASSLIPPWCHRRTWW